MLRGATEATAKNKLQEYLQALERVGAAPHVPYSCTRVGADHTPTFEARVTLPDGRVYVGSCAASKKDAEKLAALAACRALLEEAGEPTASLSGRVSGTNQATHVNPINELQEMCQGAGLALPTYEEVTGDGGPFEIEVTLPDGRSFGGTGWQKAEAKRAAAEAAVAHFRANPLAGEMTHTLWKATGEVDESFAAIARGGAGSSSRAVVVYVDLESVMEPDDLDVLDELAETAGVDVVRVAREGHELADTADTVVNQHYGVKNVADLHIAALAVLRVQAAGQTLIVVVTKDLGFAPALVCVLRDYGATAWHAITARDAVSAVASFF